MEQTIAKNTTSERRKVYSETNEERRTLLGFKKLIMFLVEGAQNPESLETEEYYDSVAVFWS
jgi:hypothetical protein